jgi:hypothetical protein
VLQAAESPRDWTQRILRIRASRLRGSNTSGHPSIMIGSAALPINPSPLPAPASAKPGEREKSRSPRWWRHTPTAGKSRPAGIGQLPVPSSRRSPARRDASRGATPSEPAGQLPATPGRCAKLAKARPGRAERLLRSAPGPGAPAPRERSAPRPCHLCPKPSIARAPGERLCARRIFPERASNRRPRAGKEHRAAPGGQRENPVARRRRQTG